MRATQHEHRAQHRRRRLATSRPGLTVGIPVAWAADVADGLASVNARGQNGTYGGRDGKTVTVKTLTDLEKYATASAPYVIVVAATITMDPKGKEIKVASDKTIVGSGTSGQIVGGGFFLGQGVHNVIIRNLTIRDSYAGGQRDGGSGGGQGVPGRRDRRGRTGRAPPGHGGQGQTGPGVHQELAHHREHGLHLRPGHVTAPSTPADRKGFLITNSTITGDVSARSFHLGRNWHAGGDASLDPQTTVRDTTLSGAIRTTPWSDMGGFPWKEDRFAEYRNTGAGAGTASEDRPHLTDAQATDQDPGDWLGTWTPTP